jgi:D-alanyl-lipoteichoic acid acyltransferase DltB (MBOAT superfamily)
MQAAYPLSPSYGYPAWSNQLPIVKSCRGIFRWEICFNLTILRMLSYSLDLHYFAQSRSEQASKSAKGMQHMDNFTLKGAWAGSDQRGLSSNTPVQQQQALHALAQDSNCLVYLAYVFYPPLYLAGPIITFQDFLRQLRHPPTLTFRQARDGAA